jgi:hypothetical protein
VPAEVRAEYEPVIRRLKFRFRPEEIDQALTRLRRVGTLVNPTNPVSESPDVADNGSLKCADAGSADHLVTGSTPHFPKKWRQTGRILQQVGDRRR